MYFGEGEVNEKQGPHSAAGLNWPEGGREVAEAPIDRSCYILSSLHTPPLSSKSMYRVFKT